MEQTAVEFLHSEYKRLLADNLVSIQTMSAISDSFSKAKQMEKKQTYSVYQIKLAVDFGSVYYSTNRTLPNEDIISEFVKTLKK